MIDIIQGNCLFSPRLGVGADVMLVDPPYAEHVHANAVSAGTGGAGVRARDFGFASVSAALMATLAGYTAQVRRWSLIYTDLESAHLWRAACEAVGSEYVRSIPWVRWSQPQMSGDRPPTGAEMLLVFHAPRAKGVRMHWNGPGSLTHLAHKCMRGAGKHPTQKPLDQALDLVSWFSDPGEQVIDPCAGAGTTARACALLGRSCLAVDKSAVWVGAGTRRVYDVEQFGDLRMYDDAERVRRFVESTCEEATRVPPPKGKHDVRTWERAQRRLSDVPRLTAALEE